MADRIVLMRDGRIEQQGAPLDLYERPATRYVAGFLGSPAMNFLPARVVEDGGTLALQLADSTRLALPTATAARCAAYRDRDVVLGLRPEHINRAGELRSGQVRCRATTQLVQPTGSRTYATLALGGAPVVAELQAHDAARPHEAMEIAIDMNRAVLIDPQTDQVL